MFICKCFCQEAVSSRTTKENPNTFPISVCNWNFVVFTSFIWLNVYSTFLFSMIYSWQQKNCFKWMMMNKTTFHGFFPTKAFSMNSKWTISFHFRPNGNSKWKQHCLIFDNTYLSMQESFDKVPFLRGRGICSKSLGTFLREPLKSCLFFKGFSFLAAPCKVDDRRCQGHCQLSSVQRRKG